MPKPYDAALKQLIDAYAGDWLAWLRPRLGVPADAAFDALDADLGTVSPQADKLFRFRDPSLGLAHLELQAGPDPSLPARMLVYNVLAEYRHGGPVHSVVLLLRREAATADLTGTLHRRFADGTTYHDFRYAIVRLWEASSEELLTGPLGTLPLAGLTDDAAANLAAVIARSMERVRREVTPEAANTLVSTTYVLLGLRHDRATIERLYQGVREMEESVTYQAIIEKGECREARRLIRRLGEKAFGPIPVRVEAALTAETDLDRLEQIAERLRSAATWDELMGGA